MMQYGMKIDINMKILSISDVITNSSSEVFVIHAKPGFQEEINQEVPQLLNNICELLELNPEDLYTTEVAEDSYMDEDWYYYVNKNDLLIHSNGDNSIPYWLMTFIEDLYCSPKYQDKFSGYYADDIEPKNVPVYDYRKNDYVLQTKNICSIQRCHLG